VSLPAYPSYRDSGVPWLGQVPAHWTLTRLRFIARLNPSKSEIGNLPPDTEVSFLPMDAIGDDGSLRLDATRPLSAVEQGYTYFRDGDLLIAKITPCFENGKGALATGLLGGIGFGTTELIVVRPLPGRAVGAYLHWLFVGPDFRNAATAAMYGAGGQKRVPDEFVRDFVVAVPPPAEQRAIAAFLDRECGKMDALVAEQERLIALLKEKRQAAISHAVTKGLDPTAPMKDSGVAWLGEVPAHWEVVRGRRIFVERDERSEDGDETLLTVSHLTGVTPRAEKTVYMFEAETTEGYKLCHRGDLVINTLWAWMGAMGVTSEPGIVSPAYHVYTPTAEVEPGYVNVLVRMGVFAREAERWSKGVWSSRLRLYPEEFLKIEFPLPSLAEQQAITAFLDRECSKLDTLTNEAERAIALLKERRAALISAAVTGKIDVRGLVAPTEAKAA
jgi:type I restriction enzyme S subunit